MNWWKRLRGKVRQREVLSRHTTFGIGGPARFLVEPYDTEDLKLLLSFLKRGKISFLLLGAGSNLLVSDRGVAAAVVRLSAGHFTGVSCDGPLLTAGAGVPLSSVIRHSLRQGLTGAEFLCGIPGTVGGALAMNAGISEEVKSQKSKVKRKARNIAQIVRDVTVMDRMGRIRTLGRSQIPFGYRSSGLCRYIIISCRLALSPDEPRKIKERIHRYTVLRRKAQAGLWRSAGSVFKNPAGCSAGMLIDRCGLKGTRIGGACISRRHANFIINNGNATAEDVLRLMALARDRVKKVFGVDLEPEVVIWKK